MDEFQLERFYRGAILRGGGRKWAVDEATALLLEAYLSDRHPEIPIVAIDEWLLQIGFLNWLKSRPKVSP